jgi:hypothetical protein
MNPSRGLVSLVSERLSDGSQKALRVFAVQGSRWPTDSEPVVALPGNDVEMNVHHDLMGRRAIVLENVVVGGSSCGHDGPRQSREHAANSGRRFVGELVEEGLSFLWNDQGMAQGKGTDVEKCQDVLILVDSVAGNLAIEDLAEDRGL